MLEAFSGTVNTQIQELNKEENESEEIKKRKKLLNYIEDILR